MIKLSLAFLLVVLCISVVGTNAYLGTSSTLNSRVQTDLETTAEREAHDILQ